MHTPAWICLRVLPHLGPVSQSRSGVCRGALEKAFASNSSDKSSEIGCRF